MSSSNVDWKPRVGMKFDNIDVAYQFWLTYSVHAGFGVRKRYANKNKDGTISSCRFVCSKEGVRKIDKRDVFVNIHKAETRTDCKARISLVCQNGNFVIHEFVEDHNHPLQLPETTHMLASHRKITEVQAYEIDLADDSGLRQKSTFQLMSTHAGNRANLGFTRLDVKNYLSARRQRSMMYGDVGCLSQYFQRQLLENPSFFHAYQMDIEEQITNVFWCDANMVLDYGYFGDVVSLDTTYCTNHANRPLALFSGFNHYRSSIIFGAALLYDETIESFKWLFDTFLQAHNHKKPKLIQMGKVYTHVVFELFQNEFKLFLALSILERNESHSLCEYVITMVNHEGFWRVSFDRASTSITCSCRKFETFGILCSHALKVFEANDVKVIPEKYILRRWAREARCGIVHDFRGKEVEGDPKLSRTRKFRQVVSKFIRVAAEASPCEEHLKIVDNYVDVMCKKIKECRLQVIDNEINENPTFVSNNVMQPTGFKIRPNLKRHMHKRPKSFIEKKKAPSRRKKAQVYKLIYGSIF
uniref:Protein FAR-RED IMPAIRED RESPONSE 1-like n=1 Tax=Cicer arietinum TaxID=3827 RepID=A0A3Q7YFU8_CICAR|nr:protein FAR-RED IMPAIRED RESPONSE 1-like [Cicer arietinum]